MGASRLLNIRESRFHDRNRQENVIKHPLVYRASCSARAGAKARGHRRLLFSVRTFRVYTFYMYV